MITRTKGHLMFSCLNAQGQRMSSPCCQAAPSPLCLIFLRSVPCPNYRYLNKISNNLSFVQIFKVGILQPYLSETSQSIIEIPWGLKL